MSATPPHPDDRDDVPGDDVTVREDREVSVERESYPPPTPPPPGYDADMRLERAVSAKTSAAAVFALVFGLSALFCALALILSPLAILFGIVGLILGIVGLRKASLPEVTGKGVAIGGLVLSALGLLLGIVIVVGAATFLSSEENIQRIEDQLRELRSELPTTLPS